MASIPLTAVTAGSTANFVSSLGINTHFDFNAYGYQNLSVTEQAINYLGIKNLRDSAMNPTDAQTWLQVANATGAKFDDYMPEGSPTSLQNTLNLVPSVASEGILNFIEGGNEDDDPYAISNGNSLAWTAQFQQQVYQVGHSLGLSVINMSFGAGWTAANNWQGDYGSVGNLAAYTDYANAHTYPLVGQTPDSAIQRLNGLAELAASPRPVITTEVGWDENMGFSQADVAKYVVDAALDGWKDGDVKTYFYALYDDGSGKFGLMNQDGTPKPAGVALHDLTTLLADPGAGSFTPGTLVYGIDGTLGGENSQLLQKSDGSYWIAVWDENDAAHTVTLNLGATASTIVVFDPVTGTSATQTLNNATSVSLNLQGDPLLVEVITTASATTPPTTTPPGSTTTSPSLTPNDLTVSVPASETVVAGMTLAITGVSITDPWSAASPGLMALNLWDNGGAPLLINGQKVSGTISGTLAQLNADLSTLSYEAGSTGSDSVAVDVWNQAGVEVTQTIGVTITASPNDLTVSVPAAETTVSGATLAITGVSISDPWSAASPGLMALNLWDNGGAPLLINGQKVSGTISGTLAQLNADLATLSYQAGSTGSDSVSVDVWNQAGVEVTKTIGVTVKPALVIAAPAGAATTVNAIVPIAGLSASDVNSGNMTLKVSATVATLLMTDGTGAVIAGSGTHAISVTGTLSQINTDLAHLSYLAGSSVGSDSIAVNVVDQAGAAATAAVALTIKSSPATTVINIASTNKSPTINASYATINATSGNHMFFINGTHDVLSATGGTESVQATLGNNMVTTGKGNDTITIAGSGNMVNAGAGTNQITDNGSANLIVLPKAGAGYDHIWGPVLQNADLLDFRAILAGTQWNGSQSTVSNYIHTRTVNGTDTVISAVPTGVSGGASYDVATLHGTGSVSLGTVLAHALT